MVLDGQTSLGKIRRASEEVLREWIKQSERLDIARDHYRLRGERFIDFARRIGIDKSSAYRLVMLWQHRAAITSRCSDEAEAAAKCGEPFRYPGWETALEWFEGKTRNTRVTHGYRVESSDERPTPQYLVNWINEKFGPFDLDVCADRANAKCNDHFTREQDGLAQDWHGNVWMNPPYSRIEPWARKAYEYAKSGKGIVVGLLPVWTDTGWFDDYVSHAQIILLRGRVRFEKGNKGFAPFPNMIVVWDGKSTRRDDTITVTICRKPSKPRKPVRPPS